MPGVKSIVLLAFSASIGITLLILACALPQFNNFWPMFALIFYVLSCIPTIFYRSCIESCDTVGARVLHDVTMFFTSGIVVSAYALPIVLAHVPLDNAVISWGACGLAMAGNTIVFLTVYGFFRIFGREDDFMPMW